MPTQKSYVNKFTMSEQEEKKVNHEEVTVSEESNEETMDNESTPSEAAESEETHEYGEAESEDPLTKLQAELEEEKGKFLRLYAEFENFRRRNAKERLDLIASASADLMKELLPVMDDFGRAIEVNKTSEDIKAVKEGFELLHQKLTKTLESKGLKAVDSKGQPFDAEIHEAIAQVPVQDAKEKGMIIDVVERGYTLNEKVIRHPKVVVGS